ncbi:hypothetical protein JCM10449v2_001716 [Rhodotorula kratochvilovae]
MDTLRLTGSYLVAPARYASGAVWYALGYSSALPPGDTPEGEVRPRWREVADEAAGAAPSEEDEQVVRALREAMRDWEEKGSESRPEEAEDEEGEGEGDVGAVAHEHKDVEDEVEALTEGVLPADVPLPPSPSTPDGPPSPPSTPPPPSRPFTPLLQPRARPLSSLSRLSRRATLCLSRLVVLEELDFSSAGEERGEPGERERELVERVMEEEVERVRGEVEELVELAIKEAEEDEAQTAAPVEQLAAVEEEEPVVPVDDIPAVEEEPRRPLTWFNSEAGQAFERISVSSEGVETDGFLLAMESLVSMGEQLAPAAASLCAGELLADIGRVRARRLLYPSRTGTLEQLLQSERKERRRPATDALEWLVRLLGFTAQAFRHNLESWPAEEFSRSFSIVWDGGFDRHFNWLVRPLFKVIIRACPSRASVYSKLAFSPEAREEDVRREMRHWLERVEEVVRRVEGAVERARRR